LEENWRFTDPENVAVITLKQIISDGQPILHVTHEIEDGGWQFLGWGDAKPEDAKVVALRTIVRLDPSVQEVADLPLGWHAWRKGPNEPWQRGKME
jgi:hypothetical protein